jgi:hypothetical protein
MPAAGDVLFFDILLAHAGSASHGPDTAIKR